MFFVSCIRLYLWSLWNSIENIEGKWSKLFHIYLFIYPYEAVNIHILCIQDKFKFCVELWPQSVGMKRETQDTNFSKAYCTLRKEISHITLMLLPLLGLLCHNLRFFASSFMFQFQSSRDLISSSRSRLYSGQIGAFSIICCFYEYSRFEEKIYFFMQNLSQ